MTTSRDAFFFNGIPTAAAGPYVAGANFAVATYYIPIPYMGDESTSVQIAGDGTFAATWTVRHTDMPMNFDRTAIDLYAVGDGRTWKADATIGTQTILAATDATGSARVSWSNQPRRYSQIVLIVTVGGRAVGAASGT